MPASLMLVSSATSRQFDDFLGGDVARGQQILSFGLRTFLVLEMSRAERKNNTGSNIVSLDKSMMLRSVGLERPPSQIRRQAGASTAPAR